MKAYKNKRRMISLALVALIMTALFAPTIANAGGISIDAGLTPAVNRIMVRSQMRILERYSESMMGGGTMKMEMRILPVMVAYGVRSDLTVMARMAHVWSDMTMSGSSMPMMNGKTSSSGFGDLLLLAKYRMVRINKPGYTLGIAPTLALELPTGSDGIGSDSYDLRGGVFFSGRHKSWAMDLDLSYINNGTALANDNEINPGDEYGIDIALARQFGLGSNAMLAIAPVLEASYKKTTPDIINDVDVMDTGESVTTLAPGLKLTYGSLIFEGLVRFPVSQEQEGMQTEHKTMFLFGFRLMN